MAGRQFKFHDGESGAALAVRVKLGNKPSGFVNVQRDGTIVIRLKRGSGDANQELLNFLSEQLDISGDKLQVLAGAEGDKKLVSILDLDPKQIQKRILERIQ